MEKDNPKVEADLAVFSAQNNLPPCTTANGCFTKVVQYSNIPNDEGYFLFVFSFMWLNSYSWILSFLKAGEQKHLLMFKQPMPLHQEQG